MYKKIVLIALIITITSTLVSPIVAGSNIQVIYTTGRIVDGPQIQINVNINEIIDQNNLKLGFNLDWDRWKSFVDRPVQRQLAQETNPNLIRIFDFRKTSQYGIPNLMPCTQWNEATKTGTWDWTYIDQITNAIFSVGAEPIFCLGWAYYYGDIQRFLPSGMEINPTTGLPYPDSYAAYATEWVKHFKATGQPVRFYEIMNEPYYYFGWNGQNSQRLGYYVELWNTAAISMRQENPNVLLSNDAIDQKNVLDYWITNGEPVDFVDFHKYDANSIGEYTEEEMFSRAERIYFDTTTTYYGIADAKQKILNTWGKNALAICSELNYNSGWETGTDPKIAQMTGAVWLALVLRTGILKDLDYSTYFEFSSSKALEVDIGSESSGFGLINNDDNQPWYPYYVYKMI